MGLLTFIGQSGIAKSTIQCTEELSYQPKKLKALERTKTMLACLENHNNFFENYLMRSQRNIIRKLPNVPSLYVGVWRSSRPGCTYIITLKDDGSFSAEPENCRISNDYFSGSWGVSSNSMIWMYDVGRVWPPDVNKIEASANNDFRLIEENGSRTTFHRLGNTIGELFSSDSSDPMDSE